MVDTRLSTVKRPGRKTGQSADLRVKTSDRCAYLSRNRFFSSLWVVCRQTGLCPFGQMVSRHPRRTRQHLVMAILKLGQPPRMFLVEFMVEFIDFFRGLIQGSSSRRGDLVDSSPPPSNVFKLRFQQLSAFQSMKKRIESSRPDAIAVLPEFLHHPKSKDRLMSSMYEHVDAYKPGEEFPPNRSSQRTPPLCPH